MIRERTGLLIVDVQKGFSDPYWGKRNNADAEVKIAQLLAVWRQKGWPIFHVQHLSTSPSSALRPGQPGCDFQECVAPMEGETVIQKNVNSAFIGTNLEQILREKGVTSIVVVGLTTNHCVSTTVRMAGNLGLDVFVVDDATATFDRVGHDGRHFTAEEIHAVSLANLHNEFATVVNSTRLLQECESLGV
jgi:nicotinamidase-related amidase